MFDNPLTKELADIRQIADQARRGRQFERFVGRLFGAQNFQVRLDPRAARPRQVDLLAARGLEAYLVECKWRATKADIDDLDSLRARLRRTSGVIGLLISYNGFTGSVLSDVTLNARQPVLLMSGDELERVVNGRENLLRLLRSKTDALLSHGEALLDEPVGRRPRSRRSNVAFPVASAEYLLPNGTRTRVLDCGGSFDQFVFASELPDIDWVPAPGSGVTLDIDPQFLDERSLVELMERLTSMGWTTEQARWNIQQSSRNWHGLGVADLISTLKRWAERAGEDGHHTEQLCYVDRCEGGFYTLTAGLWAHRVRGASNQSLSFQLPGIPLDNAPFVQLCRAIGAHEPAHFRTRADKSVERRRFDHGNLTLGEPRALLVSPETLEGMPVSEWAVGIVVDNPFRRLSDAEPGASTDANRMLRESEYLICALGQHHPIDYPPVEYFLRRMESAWSSDAMVCYPVADWRRTNVDDE